MVGCTAAVDARDNTGTNPDVHGAGVPIYWLNGLYSGPGIYNYQFLAADNEDFYDGSWGVNEGVDRSEHGENAADVSESSNYPATGCDHDGTAVANKTLGSNRVRVGRPDIGGTIVGPINGGKTRLKTNPRHMYGLSQVFHVEGRPNISGLPEVGMTLTAGMGSIEDPDGLPATFPDDYSFRWQREDADGSNPVAVGTDSHEYTLVDADGDKKIRVEVTFTDGGGNALMRESNRYPPGDGTVTPALPDQVYAPVDWVLTPSGLRGGDKFRLLFISSTRRDGLPTDIATYNTFIRDRAAAGHAAIRAYSSGFRVVGCTVDVDARDNTRTTYTVDDTGVPIYWLGPEGNRVADDYVDFYDGGWDDEVGPTNEFGAVGLPTYFPRTGCDHDGTKRFNRVTGDAQALGNTLSSIGLIEAQFELVGNAGAPYHGPLAGASARSTDPRSMYGLSQVFVARFGPFPTLRRLALTDNNGAAITLDPAFDRATITYTASVEHSVMSTTVAAETTNLHSTAVIKLGGTEDTDGTVDLAVGANTITVEVTHEEGNMRTYTVTVTRAADPSDPNLSSLTLSGVTLDQTFDPATTTYTASVANSVTSTTMTVQTTESNATVRLTFPNGNIVDITPFLTFPVNLPVGTNTFTVEVTATDGDMRTYTVTVTRAAPARNATLISLSLSGVTLNAQFMSGTTTYSASVRYSVDATTVTAQPTDANATAVIKLGGVTDTDGTVGLAVGANTITVEVTDEDGSTMLTYTVIVTRAAPSSDATLSSLSLTGVTLTPAFDPATTTYTGRVSNSGTSTTLTLQTADANATVVFKLDANTFTVEVTAEDGNTMLTYTVTGTLRGALQ